jgi:hypothetical protein
MQLTIEDFWTTKSEMQPSILPYQRMQLIPPKPNLSPEANTYQFNDNPQTLIYFTLALTQQWNMSIRFSTVWEGTWTNLTNVIDADQLDPSMISKSLDSLVRRVRVRMEWTVSREE